MVTRSTVPRSSAMSVAVLVVLVAGWLVLAPTRFGGSTDYVTTHGISMEPRFHTGDLAVVRPAADYRVGDVVAYHSDLLHTVVLHRIIGRDRDRYVFKGDNPGA
jgi:signal peptidase I